MLGFDFASAFQQSLDFAPMPDGVKLAIRSLPVALSSAANASNTEPISGFVEILESTGKAHNFDLCDLAPEYRSYLSDCYVLLGRYGDALRVFPRQSVGGRSTTQSDRLLSLKLEAGVSPTGADILLLFGPKVTKLGQDRLLDIEAKIDRLLISLVDSLPGPLLHMWSAGTYRHPYSVFSGWPEGYELTKLTSITGFSFSLNESVASFVAGITREAENEARQEMGIPNVGEGWVSETRLFYEIKAGFPDEEVVHHAAPKWLGRQHLDVFLPTRSVAIEYQGLQHDQPVDHFGGEEAHKKTIQRDQKKKRLCEKNGIRLMYVRPGYDLAKVLTLIRGYTVR